MKKPAKPRKGAPVTTGRTHGRQVLVRFSPDEEKVMEQDEKKTGKSAPKLLREKYFKGRV